MEEGESYRILDVGSSSGEALDTLVDRLEVEKECSFEALALDVDDEMVGKCYEANSENVVRAAGQNIPLKSGSVDIVISSQLHLNSEDIEEVVEEVNRVLDSEGYAVLSSGYGGNPDYRGMHQGGFDVG